MHNAVCNKGTYSYKITSKYCQKIDTAIFIGPGALSVIKYNLYKVCRINMKLFLLSKQYFNRMTSKWLNSQVTSCGALTGSYFDIIRK